MPNMDSSVLLYLGTEETPVGTSTAEVLAHLMGEDVEISERTQLAYICVDEEVEGPGEDPENSVRVSLPSFLDGDVLPGAPSLSLNVGAYLDGSGLRSSVQLYLQTPLGSLGTQDCFIDGQSIENLTPKGAIRFEAAKQQYAVINDNTNYDRLSGYTLNLWVKPRTDSTLVKQGIVVKEGVIETWVHNVGNSFGMRINVAGVWYQALTTSFTKDRWYMLTVRYDGSGFRAYMNGVQIFGVNAPGTPTENNAPWYFGRYPSLGTYSDIDLCDVQFWNYALDNTEISAMYKAPARRSCISAYIAEVEPTTLSSLKRCYLNSPSDATNPFSIVATQMAQFAEQAVDSIHRAYINAGGEQTVTWDTRFVTDLSTDITWDNLIMVRGNQDRINEIQLGDIVYPITRKALRQIRIPTSYDPLTLSGSTDCWMVAYHEAEVESVLCYIPTVNSVRDRKSLFIQGFFESVTGATNCYISNTEAVVPAQFLYMEGFAVFKWTWTKQAHISSFIDNTDDSQNAYMRGGITETAIQQSYVHAAPWITTRRNAFIMSDSESLEAPEHPLFIQGNVGIRRDSDLYIFGHHVATPSVDAYISAVPTVFEPKLAYINAETVVKLTKLSHLRAHEGITDGQDLYLKADIAAEDTQESFIHGRTILVQAKRTYIAGPTAVVATEQQPAYVVNDRPVATKDAFIVSGPQSSVGCYIVNIGSAVRGKSVYIAA